MESFYWHDYETWGVNPSEDMPSQFAGVRTDQDFNILGEPLNIYCKPALDTLPRVAACMITGITPSHAEAQGLAERDFFSAIHSQLAQAGTCGVGYNSIRFDDEVTRYGLYRNFYDPYAREWQHGNTRWDIIDMVRLCYAVRPDDFIWPTRDDGVVSFRLEELTAANGLSHEAAHDALSDVYATINLARLIKQRQPKLFAHVFGLRHKQAAQQALELGSCKPKFHISSRFGSEHACGSLILPVAENPSNKNEVMCVDLRYSPQSLLDCSAQQLNDLLFTKLSDLPPGIDRIPLKSVHINRSPVVLSPGLIDETVASRLNLNLKQCEQHRQQLLAYKPLAQKLRSMMTLKKFDDADKAAEAKLYGGFIPNEDKVALREIVPLNGSELAAQSFSFKDERLPEMLFRYRARNFPSSLNPTEEQEWLEYCRDKLLKPESQPLESELEEVSQLIAGAESEHSKELLVSFRDYLLEKYRLLGA